MRLEAARRAMLSRRGIKFPPLPTGEAMGLLPDPSNGWNLKRNIPTAEF